MKKLKIFYSYSHADEDLRKKLDEHLAFLKHDDVITWYDREIIPGQELNEEIKRELNEAEIILLLISSSFLSSFYCYNVEMKRAMERHESKDVVVIPVLLKHCVWQKAPFSKLLLTPRDAHPITDKRYWDSIDEAFTNVAEGVGKAVEQIIKQKERKLLKSTNENFASRTTALNDFPKPSRIFTGRANELKQFEQLFKKFNLIAVEGLGGIGKTEFVAKFIDQYVLEKERVIWLEGTSESKFDIFIENAGYGDVLKGDNKTKLTLFSGFKDLLERDKKIVFLDNFQAINDSTFSHFISFAFQYLQDVKIILITKSEPLINNTTVNVLRIFGLKDDGVDYAKKLIESQNQKYGHVTEEDLHTICESIEGHPLAIQLALQLMHYGVPASNIVNSILQYKGRRDVEALTKRLFTDMYYHASTTEAEKSLLRKFSVFKERVNKEAIEALYEGTNISLSLSNLIDKFLITFSGGLYGTHPLIKEFSYELLENKIETHSKAALYYINQRSGIFSPAIEEKIYFHLLQSKQWNLIAREIENKGRLLISSGLLSLVREVLDSLKSQNIYNALFDILYGDIEQISGNWEKAKEYFENAKSQVHNKKVKAQGILLCGELLFRKGEMKNALILFEEAYNFSKQNQYLKEEARSLNDIGLVYEKFGEIDLALDKMNKSIRIRESINDVNGLADSLTNRSNLFRKKFETKKALDDALKSKSLYETIGSKEGTAIALNNVGIVYNDMGDYNKALENYKNALHINKEIGAKPSLCFALNNMATLFEQLDNFDEALKYNLESLKIADEFGNKISKANTLHNLGALYLNKKKDYNQALIYLFNSLGLYGEMRIVEGDAKNWILLIRDQMNLNDFKILAKQVYNTIPENHQKYIPIQEFCKEPITIKQRIGRNDPCPCGSGKKYKNCHSKIEQ